MALQFILVITIKGLPGGNIFTIFAPLGGQSIILQEKILLTAILAKASDDLFI